MAARCRVELDHGSLEGRSAALNLSLQWDNGRLRWHDPETGQHMPTYEDEHEARAENSEARRHDHGVGSPSSPTAMR